VRPTKWAAAVAAFLTAGVWLCPQVFAIEVAGKIAVAMAKGPDAKQEVTSREALRTALLKGKGFELYSIYGGALRRNEKRPFPDAGEFLGWPIIGKVAITDAKQIQQLVDPFVTAGSCFGNASCPRAMCFFPRHAIRVSYGGKNVDLLICFECAQVEASGVEGFSVDGAPEALFDATLKKAGIQLSRDIESRNRPPPSSEPIRKR
jgi:hypothetical protein